MVFFTFGIARKLFEVYPRDVAGEINVHLFPAYYLAVSALLGVAFVVGGVCSGGRWRNFVALLLIVLAIAALAANALWLGPWMQSLPLPEKIADFRKLHGIAMSLNLAAILLTFASPLVFSAIGKSSEKN